MAGIMAEIQRTRKPSIIIAATCFVIFWFLMSPASLFTVCPQYAEGAEFSVLPSLTMGEEYNDNVYLTRYNKLDDYITEAIPAFSLVYRTSLTDLNLSMSYDYRYYAKGTKKGDDTFRANFRDHSTLIDNFFFLDILDVADRVSLTTTTNFATQSSFVNQTDSNLFTVNPYFVMRNDTRYTPIIGYKYVNTWYGEESGVSTVDNIGYAEMITDLSSKVTFTIGVSYTDDVNKVENYDQTKVYAGPKYTYAQNNSFVYMLIGESFLNFQFENGVTKHMIWDAGFTNRYSTMVLSYQMRSDYIPDPQKILRREDRYVATLAKDTIRTSFSISLGLFEYRNAASNHLEDTVYRTTGMLSHAISPTLTLLLYEDIERQENNLNDTIVDLWESEVRLERRMLKNFTLALDYKYTNSYSHDSYPDNYVNNRFSVQLSKSF